MFPPWRHSKLDEIIKRGAKTNTIPKTAFRTLESYPKSLDLAET